MTLAAFFVEYLAQDPLFFVSVVVTVIVSVTAHELGHVFAALRQGDETPRLAGHLTLDPLVHMGPLSLGFLLLTGMAWGQTPVNPSRFRDRYGAAMVAGAGPAVNLLLALVSLTALALWMRASPGDALVGSEGAASNARFFLHTFGVVNLALLILNLIPLPPLDGASVLADANPRFARAVSDPARQTLFLFGLMVVFAAGGPLIHEAASRAAAAWIGLIA